VEMKVFAAVLVLLSAVLCSTFAQQPTEGKFLLIVQVTHISLYPELHQFLQSKQIRAVGVLPESLRLRAAQFQDSAAFDELSRYFQIDESRGPINLYALQDELLRQEFVSAAYIKPVGSLAITDDMQWPILSPPKQQAQHIVTPLFVSQQLYLNGPGGFNVAAVANEPGAKGTGVTVVDIEGDWVFDHEDLIKHNGKIVVGKPDPGSGYYQHGTAVLGVISSHDNEFGTTGIAPDTMVLGAAFDDEYPNIAHIALAASEFVNPGDIMLIELHAPGWRYNFSSPFGQKGYIAMEWWPDNAEAFRLITEKGTIIVEAAGNGSEDFDDPLYDNPARGFPPTWRNPFRRGPADTGTLIIGAGSPPPGTHGRTYGPDRSRLDFSNWGSAVDTQGWGREVTTLSYGDLYRGNSKQTEYTNTFSGTSSASPCVVGVVSAIQGITKARGKALLTPLRVRDLLRRTGKPQVDAPGRPATQRIGNRADLGQLLGEL